MSLAPLDYDRDGVIDYFASMTKMSSVIFRGDGRRITGTGCQTGVAGQGDTQAWGSVASDVDLDGWTDLVVLRQPPATGSGLAPTALFINRRDGTFADAAPGALDAKTAAVTLLCGDLDGDGLTDCLVANSTEQLLLRDRIQPAGGWVGVRLVGTVSSPDASGAIVELDGASPPERVMYSGQSPIGGEHARELVLAVGARASADVVVSWPSGIRQRVPALPAGAYHTIVEPRALSVGSRTAPADGRSRVEVVADPKAMGASVAAVDCDGCAWDGAGTVDGAGALHRFLIAPAAPASVRIVARFDGVPLAVRPRIRFEAAASP
jgi:hypothetical protein